MLSLGVVRNCYPTKAIVVFQITCINIGGPIDLDLEYIDPKIKLPKNAM